MAKKATRLASGILKYTEAMGAMGVSRSEESCGTACTKPPAKRSESSSGSKYVLAASTRFATGSSSSRLARAGAGARAPPPRGARPRAAGLARTRAREHELSDAIVRHLRAPAPRKEGAELALSCGERFLTAYQPALRPLRLRVR